MNKIPGGHSPAFWVQVAAAASALALSACADTQDALIREAEKDLGAATQVRRFVPQAATGARAAAPSSRAAMARPRADSGDDFAGVPPRARQHFDNAMKALENDPRGFDVPLAELKKALDIAPNFTRAWYSLGTTQMKKGDLQLNYSMYDEAYESYMRAYELGEQWPGLYNNIGTVLRKRGKSEEAIPFLQRGLEKYPYDAVMLLNLGQLYLSLGDTKNALDYLCRALWLRPENNQVHRELMKFREGAAICQRLPRPEAFKPENLPKPQ
ncbi:MAG: hypothetical protein GMKNLPBB_00553 [Myxococcota bacterium]|nr:hypothetical protein [Myxococcota bacterium]